jgi:ribonuclease R
MAFGLFVELADIFVDGLVHVSSLGNDYYHFDPVRHRMVGERSGQSYRLGDPVRVRLTRVDLDEGKLDFELIVDPDGEIAAAKPGRVKKPGARRRRSKTRRG